MSSRRPDASGKHAGRAPGSPPATILAVDDTPENLALLGDILQPEFSVLAATSGARALALSFADPPPDLILLDVMMPGMDGYEVLRRLRDDERTCAIPVIFVTALDATEDEAKGFALGAVDYITKPLRPPVVRARIGIHLELKRMRDLLDNRAMLLENAVMERTAEVRKALHAAEAASRAKGEFIANMSHELHTPMNGVLGMIDLSKDDPGMAADTREFLAIARESAFALNHVLTDVLDYASVADGQAEAVLAPCAPGQLAEEIIRCFAAAARTKGLQLHGSVLADVPAELSCDATKLRRVLVLLLDNALKFTSKGGVLLTVSHAQQQLHFEVSDTGCGVPADKLESIFAPFTQADGSAVRRHGGIGLGLALARKLVEIMGGKLWATSRPDEGSRFSFYIALEENCPR